MKTVIKAKKFHNKHVSPTRELNMKKIIISITLVVVFALPLAKAGMYPAGYSLWVSGDFDMPDAIKKVTTASGLKPFMQEKDSFSHVAAIRRLGEIEGAKAIETLKSYLVKGNTTLEYSYVPIEKLEVIRTLGRIGTEQAKMILLDTLKIYWEKGPVLANDFKDNKGYYRDDKDFSNMVPELLKALYRWSSDNDIYVYAKTIAESNDVKNYYGGIDGIGQRAWEISIKGEMLRKNITAEKDSAKFLLGYIVDIGPFLDDANGTGEFKALKVASAKAILERLSESTLNSLVSEFEAQQKVELSENKMGQYNRLRKQIGNLNTVIKNKKEKQEKLEAYKKQVAEQQKKEKATIRDTNG
jgi:hypothetical protein